MFGDSFLSSLFAPSIQCDGCNKKISFTGDYYPISGVCSNCGKGFALTFDNFEFPKVKFDTDGKFIMEEKEEVKE